MGFDAYSVALEIVGELRGVLDELDRRDRNLAQQVRRAATSIPLNLAEGNRRKGGNRLQLFRTAAGSASEVLAALDVASAWGYVADDRLAPARALLDRELAMLWRLTRPR